jgi:hypothetical protein
MTRFRFVYVEFGVITYGEWISLFGVEEVTVNGLTGMRITGVQFGTSPDGNGTSLPLGGPESNAEPFDPWSGVVTLWPSG